MPGAWTQTLVSLLQWPPKWLDSTLLVGLDASVNIIFLRFSVYLGHSELTYSAPMVQRTGSKLIQQLVSYTSCTLLVLSGVLSFYPFFFLSFSLSLLIVE